MPSNPGTLETQRIFRVNHVRSVIAFAVLSVSAAPVLAQRPRGADTLSPKAIADSQRVLASLDARIKANVNDAAAWHQRGFIAWAFAERAAAPNAPAGMDVTTLRRMADTSIRIAAQIATNNVYYRMDVGRFLLASGVAMTRAAAPGFFDAALEVARKGTDSLAHGEAAIESARVHWRRFDALEHRRIETQPGAGVRSVSEALQPWTNAPVDDPDIIAPPQLSMGAAIEAIKSGSMALPADVTGGKDLATATTLFREAYDFAPANPRAFHGVVMVLEDQEKWADLEKFARAHVQQFPWDPWGWMAVGLAAHRQRNEKDAAAAFDTALAAMSPSERARLDRLERVLPAQDSAKAAKSAPASAGLSRLYWALADPLWSREGNETRAEFLARVAYAEFRWTVDEFNIRGADTDRGDVFIRYGPPSLIAVFGPRIGMGMGMVVEDSGISTIWIYNTGLMFVFQGMPTFATAHTAHDDVPMVTAFKQQLPVRWDNLPSIRLDSIPTQIVRFRGGHDSVDVFLAMKPAVDSIRAAMSTPKPVRGDLWMLASNTSIAARDSMALDNAGIRDWSRRVAPGIYILRAEASADGATRGARTTSIVDASDNAATGLATHGFAISDVLLATSAEPRGAADARWTDLAIEPVVGSFAHGGQLALVWENYELGQRAGTADYDVTVTLTRGRSVLGRIGASLVGALASAAKIDRSEDHIAITFERTRAGGAAIADHVTLALGDSPGGSYTLTLQVTDKVTGKTVSRTKTIHIRS